MKRILFKTIIFTLVFSLLLSVSVSAKDGAYSWCTPRNGKKQPIFNKEASLVEEYGGFYIDKTDLCNTNGVGLRVENMLGSSINYFVVRDVNFTRDFIGIELYAKTGSIGGVFVDNVRYGLKCSSKDERIVKCYGESGKTVMIHHKNAYVRTYSSLFPTYVAELSRMDWQSVFEINAGNTLAGGFISPIKLGSDISKIYDYRIDYKGTKNITLSSLTPSGVGSNWKDYKIELTSLYPYYYMTPIVLVNYNYAFTNGVIKTEVVNGILYGDPPHLLHISILALTVLTYIKRHYYKFNFTQHAICYNS